MVLVQILQVESLGLIKMDLVYVSAQFCEIKFDFDVFALDR
jgi:hypothetical protein